jgi:hypothetical protein
LWRETKGVSWTRHTSAHSSTPTTMAPDARVLASFCPPGIWSKSHTALVRTCATSSATFLETPTPNSQRTRETVRHVLGVVSICVALIRALCSLIERQRQKPSRREASPAGRNADDSLESADEYQQERDLTQKKKKRVSRRREDDEGGERQPKQRKRKRATAPPENLDDMPPEEGVWPRSLTGRL